jgi:hypothetical protein
LSSFLRYAARGRRGRNGADGHRHHDGGRFGNSS